MENHWLYKNKIVDENVENEFEGFVYRITNIKENKFYIGRKYFNSVKRKPLTKKQKEAGRVRKEVIKSKSDWKLYTGSNSILNDDIKRLGKDSFKFEILIFGNTKGQVNYLEETIQHKFDVLLDPAYYNESIGARNFIALKKNEILLKNIKENLDIS